MPEWIGFNRQVTTVFSMWQNELSTSASFECTVWKTGVLVNVFQHLFSEIYSKSIKKFHLKCEGDAWKGQNAYYLEGFSGVTGQFQHHGLFNEVRVTLILQMQTWKSPFTMFPYKLHIKGFISWAKLSDWTSKTDLRLLYSVTDKYSLLWCQTTGQQEDVLYVPFTVKTLLAV